LAISRRLRFEILRRDGHRCFYCHDSESKLTVDHVVPVALGGTDDPTNLVAACGACNGGKTSIAPDSALVAGVKEDAMRWQMAWTAAVAEACRDGVQRDKDIAKVKRNYVTAYKGRHGEAPFLPDGWQASIGRWLDLGLPMAMIDQAISASVGRRKIAPEDRWSYFAGCCWGKLRDLGNRTKQIAEESEAAAETWEQRFERTVLDTAVLVWTDSYMASEGQDPSTRDIEAVRKSATSLFPDQVGAAAILHAAGSVAEWGANELSYGLGADDYLSAEPFHVRVAKSLLAGWASRDGSPDNLLTPDIFMGLLRQALAARDAGYQGDYIFSAAQVAGAHGGSLIDGLVTAEFSLATNADYYGPELAQCVLSQAELDHFADEAWKRRAEINRRDAERAADNPWYAQAGNAVTNAVTDENGGE
jgi:hypothetical protein